MEGQTGLVLLVPELDPIVGRWRARYDPVTSFGMTAHVTIVFPWKPLAQITARDCAALEQLCRTLPRLELVFERLGRFEQTLWLDPQPTGPIRELIDRVTAHWPEYPPYGGEFDEVIPHLTLADRRDPDTMADVVADLEPRLPLRAVVPQLSLMRFESGRWSADSQFPFAAAAQPGT